MMISNQMRTCKIKRLFKDVDCGSQPEKQSFYFLKFSTISIVQPLSHHDNNSTDKNILKSKPSSSLQPTLNDLNSLMLFIIQLSLQLIDYARSKGDSMELA